MESYGKIADKAGWADVSKNIREAQVLIDTMTDDEIVAFGSAMTELIDWTIVAAQLEENLESSSAKDIQFGFVAKSGSPGFPDADYPDSPCSGVRSSQAAEQIELNAYLLAESVRDIASRACNQTVLGANTSATCLVTDVIFVAARAVYENVQFCEGEVDEAEIEASYNRLGHIHTDLENAETNLTSLMETTETNLTTLVNSVELNLNSRINTAETNLTARVNTAESNLTTRVNQAETNLDARINTAEVNLTSRVDAAETNLTTLLLANSDAIAANAQAIEKLRVIMCDIERLLHTPQGQRESECEHCDDQEEFPYTWNSK